MKKYSKIVSLILLASKAIVIGNLILPYHPVMESIGFFALGLIVLAALIRMIEPCFRILIWVFDLLVSLAAGGAMVFLGSKIFG